MSPTEAGPEAVDATVETTFRRFESAGYMVNLAARLFERALAARIQPLGLSPGQFPALLALWEQDGLGQTELAQIVRVEQPTMAQTITRMERDGLVRREADPRDARRSVVRLTPHGRQLREPAVQAAMAVNARAAAGIDDARRQVFLEVVQEMSANLACDRWLE